MKRKQNFGRILSIAAEISQTLGLVSKSPITAGIAVGLKVLDAGMKIKSEVSYSCGDAVHYFQSKCRLPPALERFVFPLVTESKLVMKNYYSGDHHPDAYEGKIGDIEIGWLQAREGAAKQRILFVEQSDIERISDLCREAVWGEQPTKHLTLSSDGITAQRHTTDPNFEETTFVKFLSARITAFSREPSRSYMLVGPPGCGKSYAIAHVVSSGDQRSISLDIADILKVSAYSQERADPWTLTQLLRPSIIVLNDFDRLQDYQQAEWLGRMEEIRKFARTVLISVNDPTKLSKALQRVDRIDDHIVVPPLEAETAQRLLGPGSAELAAKMVGWPIAFIRDYRRRVDALGQLAADREFEELQKRVTETLANPGK